MKMIIEGMPRPSAVDAMRDGGGYQSITLYANQDPIVTQYRVDVVGHEPCGWTHPTWPEEASGRLDAHLRDASGGGVVSDAHDTIEAELVDLIMEPLEDADGVEHTACSLAIRIEKALRDAGHLREEQS